MSSSKIVEAAVELKSKFMDEDLLTQEEVDAVKKEFGNTEVNKFADQLFEDVRYDRDIDDWEIKEFTEKYADDGLRRSHLSNWKNEWLEKHRSYVSTSVFQWDESPENRVKLMENIVRMQPTSEPDTVLLAKLTEAAQPDFLTSGEDHTINLNVQSAAIRTLANLQDESGNYYGVDALVTLLEKNSDNQYLCRTIARELDNNPQALRGHLASGKIVKWINSQEGKPEIKVRLVHALAQSEYGVPESILDVAAHYMTYSAFPENFDAEKMKDIRLQAIDCFKLYGEKASTYANQIADVAEDTSDDEIRDKAMYTLTDLHEEGTRALCSIALNSNNIAIQASAIKNLQYAYNDYSYVDEDEKRVAQNRMIYDTLVSALDDPSHTVVTTAIEGLGVCHGQPESRAVLSKIALRATDINNVVAAMNSLTKICLYDGNPVDRAYAARTLANILRSVRKGDHPALSSEENKSKLMEAYRAASDKLNS